MLDRDKKSTMILERDIAVPMRDGVRLFANLFRPAADGPWAGIMSVKAYSKDKLPDRMSSFFMRLARVKFGKLITRSSPASSLPIRRTGSRTATPSSRLMSVERINQKARRVCCDHWTHKTIT